MGIFNLTIYILKFFIPSFFSVLFRAYGLGYKSKKSLIIGITAFVIYAFAVPAFLILTIGYGEFTHVSTIVMTGASMLVIIFSTDSVGKTIFLQLTQGCVTTALSVVLNLIRTVFSLSYTMLVFMLAIASPILYLIAIKYWAKPMRFMADNIHAELPAMVLMPIATTVIVYFLPVYPAQSFSNHPIYITAMMLMVELVYILYIYTFYRNLRKMSELAKIKIKSKILESEISSYKEYLQTAKQGRHDMHHHNALLLEYLSGGDVDKAIEYLNISDKHLANSSFKQYCMNVTVNSILRIYDRKAQEKGIEFGVQAEIPYELAIDAPEISILLSNLLENAIEACQNQNIFSYIGVYMKYEESGLKIEVRNSSEKDITFENGFPKSTKPGGGTGAKSVAAIVNKHKGLLRFKQESNEFVVQILFPI